MNATTTTLYRNRHERGHTRIDWLESFHTFSFGDYYEPRFMNFSDLRVINDDRVKPGGGFSTHGHRDMEIVTVVLKGELEHKDNLGNGSMIRPGEIQRMTAGTGVLHSEFNPSATEEVHLLQIWITPESKGLQPGYEQKAFSLSQSGQFQPIASRHPSPESVLIHQDAAIYLAKLDRDQEAGFDLDAKRSYWLHVATGAVEIADQILESGDALGFSNHGDPLRVTGLEPDSQVLLFELRPHQPLV
ncbi:pirin family protein [Vampirovibrio sp.]|uniref:pirin family protein n=1 Tax=Vampirovibrio sp. TaxID=2717857 RepID=UPI003593F5C3